ncbi:MAG: pentapeptide repeat-containing protein [Acidobacteria bacterium]|nr:pentapeptide repeat-containing protein [Acidobacteriota bacterium]
MRRDEILERHNLAGLNLSGYSLGGADLSSKNMRGIDLSYAHLGNANLRGCDLRNANLRNANLGAADLTGADLRYSDLRASNMEGAIILGTDFRESMRDEPLPADIVTVQRSIMLEETEAFSQAKNDGYLPLAHWGQAYKLEGGDTLNKNRSSWQLIKRKLGGVVFGDRDTFKEVRLVQQYKHYSQWAYLLTQTGFERMVGLLGFKITRK